MGIILQKEIELTGTFGWNEVEFRESYELMESGKVDRKSTISHTFPLSEAKEAFETQANTVESVKVVITP